MTRHDIRLAAAAIATVLALGAGQAAAQAQGAQPQAAQPPAAQSQGQQAPQAQQFSDDKIEQFAASFGEIMEIRQEFSAKLEQTDDADKARKLQQEASQQMVGVIEDHDISVNEYNAIAQQMQADPELRNRVIALLQQ